MWLGCHGYASLAANEMDTLARLPGDIREMGSKMHAGVVI